MQRKPDYSSATSAWWASSGKSGIKVTVLFDFDFFEKVEVMLEDMEEDDDEVVELEEGGSRFGREGGTEKGGADTDVWDRRDKYGRVGGAETDVWEEQNQI